MRPGASPGIFEVWRERTDEVLTPRRLALTHLLDNANTNAIANLLKRILGVLG